MTGIDRRNLMAAAGIAGAGAFAQSAAAAPPPTPAPARIMSTFMPKPMPFDPKVVPGLSEKLLTSHYDNNYLGAVKRLNAIQGSVGGLDPATAPVFTLNGLKREELIAWNSMILHELYFAGLAGPKAGPSVGLAQALERDFGSHDHWSAEFGAMGKALGGGSGWVLLAWSPRDGRLTNQWAGDHTMTLAGGAPILALDMYEHAYAMDYGAKAGAYVDAFLAAMSWSAANQAFARLSG
jgi:Fe-Mn family superoxide dismutase